MSDFIELDEIEAVSLTTFLSICHRTPVELIQVHTELCCHSTFWRLIQNDSLCPSVQPHYLFILESTTGGQSAFFKTFLSLEMCDTF